MKSLTACLIFSLLSSILQGQQSRIVGVVSIHNSETNRGKRQYVINAQVTDDSNKANPTTTHAAGDFELIFVGLDNGKSVSLKVEKNGLEVVDPAKLRAITGQEETVRISMAHPDSLYAFQKELNQIGKTFREKALERELKENKRQLSALRKNEASNRLKIRELEEKNALLENERQDSDEELKEVARLLSIENLDDATTLITKAFALFKKGLLEEAQKVLKDANLEKNARKLIVSREETKKFKEKIDKKDSVETKDANDLANGLFVSAQFYQTNLQYSLAKSNFELAAELVPSEPKYSLAYGNFLLSIHDYKGALKYVKSAVGLYLNFANRTPEIFDADVASSLMSLGVVFNGLNHFLAADSVSAEALRMYTALAAKNPGRYLPELAKIQNNLASIYDVRRDFNKSDSLHLEALKIRTKLAADNPALYEFALTETQFNIGKLYKTMKRYKNSEKYYLLVLATRERLAQIDFNRFGNPLARIQNNLGNFYSERREYTKATEMLSRAMGTYRRLSKNCPLTFEAEFAMVKNNLGIVYYQEKKFTESEILLQDARQTRMRLAEFNSETYLPLLFTTINSLGQLYLEWRKLTKADTVLNEALALIKTLANVNSNEYEPYLALSENNLGALYTETGDSLKAIEHLQVALNLYRRLVQANPAIHAESLANAKINIGKLYLSKKDTLKAQSFLNDALLIYDTLARADSTQYLPNKSWLHYTLGQVYLRFLQFEQAELQFRNYCNIREAAKVMDIHFDLIETIPLEREITTIYMMHALALASNKKIKEAEQVILNAAVTKCVDPRIKIKLPAFLLFDGRYDEAIKMYYKLNHQELFAPAPLAASILEDLNYLGKKGLAHQDLAKFREFLIQELKR